MIVLRQILVCIPGALVILIYASQALSDRRRALEQAYQKPLF